LKKKFGNQILYHPTTYGNELDFLFVKENYSVVIDSKYKPQYIGNSHPGLHQDIRQVSGYARLKSIRKKAGVTDDNILLKCLIIFPDLNKQDDNLDFDDWQEVKQYEKVWKVGVSLPKLG
jgi:5-methylcytosine-specific restriction enzyme subunit McrC